MTNGAADSGQFSENSFLWVADFERLTPNIISLGAPTRQWSAFVRIPLVQGWPEIGSYGVLVKPKGWNRS
jgi:hypothetical protein